MGQIGVHVHRSGPDCRLVLGPPSEDPGLSDASLFSTDHVVVVADARLDNEADLRRELHLGLDEPTSMVLARGYVRWGEALPDRLRGDFAIVLLDRRINKLLAFRDPFGVRPLVYRETSSDVWVASSVRQVLATFPYAPAFNEQMVVEYLLWRDASPEATFFADIVNLLPGHTLRITARSTSVERYWYPPVEPASFPTRTTYYDELRHLMFQAVERRMVSTSPVVIHVSGGLDSSSIAAIAGTIHEQRPSLCPLLVGASAVYDRMPCDESEFIDAVDATISFPVERWDGTRSDPSDLLRPNDERPAGNLATTGGTRGDLEIANQHGATVILAGEGGDQLMTGEGMVLQMIAEHKWRSALGGILFYPGATLASRRDRFKMLVRQSLPLSLRRWRARFELVAPSWLRSEFHGLADSLLLPEPADLPFVSQVERLTWNRLETANSSRGVDAMQSVALSSCKEYRLPFLDRDLVSHTLRAPTDYLPRPGPNVRLHREIAPGILPDKVASRRTKADLTPALKHRVRLALPLIKELLFRGPWCAGDFVDRPQAQSFLDFVLSQASQPSSVPWRQLWAIVTLEAWLRSRFGYDMRALRGDAYGDGAFPESR
jgi:asparagine synthase (glutamine-hydrolysing)